MASLRASVVNGQNRQVRVRATTHGLCETVAQDQGLQRVWCPSAPRYHTGALGAGPHRLRIVLLRVTTLRSASKRHEADTEDRDGRQLQSRRGADGHGAREARRERPPRHLPTAAAEAPRLRGLVQARTLRSHAADPRPCRERRHPSREGPRSQGSRRGSGGGRPRRGGNAHRAYRTRIVHARLCYARTAGPGGGDQRSRWS